MGLDMYLNAKRYLWDFGEHSDKEIAADISSKFPELKGRRVKEVSAEVMYWRKANQIHRWFVEQCQGGVDECQETDISRDQLQALLDRCKQVLENRKLAMELLPPQEGFFFGGKELDQYYWADVESTKTELEAILAEDWKGWDFIYRSSW